MKKQFEEVSCDNKIVAIIKLRGVTTKFKIYFFAMQTFKELIEEAVVLSEPLIY